MGEFQPFCLLLVALCTNLIAGESNYTVTEEVWFDIEIKDFDGPGDDYRGRLVIGMFGDTTPMTCMNFIKIAQGFKRAHDKLHYKNTHIHRVVKDFLVQMGDVTVGDGTGSRSIYGDKFIDENFIISHRAAGYVSMANNGKDTNGSQFFILTGKARWLDGNHVVFGKVVKGMDVIETLNEIKTNKATGEPRKRIKIVDCGIVGLSKKYELTEAETWSNKDMERIG